MNIYLSITLKLLANLNENFSTTIDWSFCHRFSRNIQPFLTSQFYNLIHFRKELIWLSFKIAFWMACSDKESRKISRSGSHEIWELVLRSFKNWFSGVSRTGSHELCELVLMSFENWFSWVLRSDFHGFWEPVLKSFENWFSGVLRTFS